MKILQITTSSRGGAGIAALRLHNALRGMGIASAFISNNVSIDFEGNEFVDPFFEYKKPSFLNRIQLKIQAVLFPKKLQKMKSELQSKAAHLNYEIASLPLSVYALETHPLVQEAEVLNLHMVHSILNYEGFFGKVKKPIVWTFHDMNPFLGLFHYHGDDARNSELIAELDNNCKEIKTSAIKKIGKGAVISPSQWLLDLAEQSGVFSSFVVKKSIANSIDLSLFSTKASSNLRQQHGVSADEKVILFVAGILDIPRKGMDLMLEALEKISLPLTVFTLGKGAVETSNNKVKIIPLGFKSDPLEIAACYHAADAFVLASREDNLPNTMLESLATGTPVISFPVGGMKEHIKEGHTGVLASNVSAAALAEAIERFYEGLDQYHSEEIRSYAETHFSLNKQAEAYKNIYNQLLNL